MLHTQCYYRSILLLGFGAVTHTVLLPCSITIGFRSLLHTQCYYRVVFYYWVSVCYTHSITTGSILLLGFGAVTHTVLLPCSILLLVSALLHTQCYYRVVFYYWVSVLLHTQCYYRVVFYYWVSVLLHTQCYYRVVFYYWVSVLLHTPSSILLPVCCVVFTTSILLGFGPVTHTVLLPCSILLLGFGVKHNSVTTVFYCVCYLYRVVHVSTIGFRSQ